MNPQEEQYVHFVSSIDNLNDAWKILHEIKGDNDNPLLSPAFQFALIDYSIPYKHSRGFVKRHKLDETRIPEIHSELHKKILEARDQILAHADLTVKEPMLCVINTPRGPHPIIVKNVIRGTDLLPKINDIIELIEQTLDSMHVERKQLEQQLPPN